MRAQDRPSGLDRALNRRLDRGSHRGLRLRELLARCDHEYGHRYLGVLARGLPAGNPVGDSASVVLEHLEEAA